MGLFEQFPYTNFHELNLDWFLTTFKDLLKEWEDQQVEFQSLKDAWEYMRTWVTDYFQDLDVQEEINEKLDSMAADGSLDEILYRVVGPFATDFNNRIEVLESRMDTFASLPPGSTAGNAELLDIRIGSDGYTYASAGDAVRGQIDRAYQILPQVINAGNYSNYMPSMDALTGNAIYFLVLSGDPATQPTGTPEGVKANRYYVLRTNQIGTARYQELIFEGGTVWRRMYYSGQWWRWWITGENSPVLASGSALQAILPDLDTAGEGDYYMVPTGTDPANMPATIRFNNYAILKSRILESEAGGCFQQIYSQNGERFQRFKQNATTWEKWLKQVPEYYFEVAADGTGDFTSVLDCLDFIISNDYKNPVIYIKSGVYDIINEYETKYGATYFDTIDSTSPHYQGLPVRNGMKIFSDPNAILYCHYTGNNVDARTRFSCINMEWGDGFLYGVNIDAANVRYAIHDDPIIHKDYRWRHEYHGCRLTIDYTTDIQPTAPHAVIGGGLGQRSNIVIENCIFNQIGYGTDNTGVVGYHNCVLNNSLSHVTIKDNFFVSGTAYCSWYGPSTGTSAVIVTNNRLKSAPLRYAEDAGLYNIQNVALLAWNNEIS